MIQNKVIKKFRVPFGKGIHLKNYDPGWAQSRELKGLGKEEVKGRARDLLQQNLGKLSAAQELLYADHRYSVLIILQGMDASGKDGVIKHVMSGLNPQGCQVYSFKTPSTEELDHNFLWRYSKALPERGRIGIFNRSYYEEVLVVRVHPEWLAKQHLPSQKLDQGFWKARYEDINSFERHLVRNGTLILKFFLHISKKEQQRRFLDRLDRPEKNWKFSAADLVEREFWNRYMAAYEDALSATSTDWAPWYVVPADHKWVTRAVVAGILTSTLRSLDLSFPKMSGAQSKGLDEARRKLLRK